MVDNTFEPTHTYMEPTEDTDVLNPLYTTNDNLQHLTNDNLQFLTKDADETDEIEDYKPNPHAKTILVLPKSEQMTGTSDAALLWKWHKMAGCINSLYILLTCQHSKGMDAVCNIRK